MSKGNESWGRFAAKAAMLGVVVLVAAFVGVRLANAGPGEPVRKALTVSGTLTGPMVGATTTATFRFYRALMGGEALCSPVVSIRDGMERNPTTGAFSVDVSLEQDDVAGEPRRKCPDTLFHDPNAYVEVVIGGTSVVPRRPINPVPYAVYAQQYGTPDCPVGYELRPDPAFTGARRLCVRRGRDGTTVLDEVVRVGVGASAFWIDRYEASVSTSFEIPPPEAPILGRSSDDYGSALGDNGEWMTGRYALSIRDPAGAPPSRFITWFQANTACRFAGKRLPEGDEWLMAAQGTPDAGCHASAGDIAAAVRDVVLSTCRSTWGAQDMIGNAAEWTADWAGAPGDTTSNTLAVTSWPRIPSFGEDQAFNVGGSVFEASGVRNAGLPSATIRGGSWRSAPQASGIFVMDLRHAPSSSSPDIGFRCVIPR